MTLLLWARFVLLGALAAMAVLYLRKGDAGRE
jgi:hypothetical protein